MNAIQQTNEFLCRYGMDQGSVDMRQCTNQFMLHMQEGLEGHSSSLMMIPTYLSLEGEFTQGDKVIALDAGGTNFRASLVRMDNGGATILKNEVFPMPGTCGTITKDVFLNVVCDKLEPLLQDSQRVGFCFSFPAEILPNHDGRLYGFNKEIKVIGSEGMEICREIRQRLETRGAVGPTSFILLNDTAATMLGGMAKVPADSCDGYIGFILGTGINSCYAEKTERIKKQKGAASSHMIINMESGGFSAAPAGELDRVFDATTANPGDHIFEKMVSGGYLGDLILTVLKRGGMDGLFSPVATEKIIALDTLALAELSTFLEAPYKMGGLLSLLNNDNDIAVAYTVANCLLDRAAKLVVCNIAAIMEQMDLGRFPYRPTCVVAEGSTFYKAYSFREKFDYYVRSFLSETLGRHCRITHIENATLVGSAVAAMLNK